MSSYWEKKTTQFYLRNVLLLFLVISTLGSPIGYGRVEKVSENSDDFTKEKELTYQDKLDDTEQTTESLTEENQLSRDWDNWEGYGFDDDYSRKADFASQKRQLASQFGFDENAFGYSVQKRRQTSDFGFENENTFQNLAEERQLSDQIGFDDNEKVTEFISVQSQMSSQLGPYIGYGNLTCLCRAGETRWKYYLDGKFPALFHNLLLNPTLEDEVVKNYSHIDDDVDCRKCHIRYTYCRRTDEFVLFNCKNRRVLMTESSKKIQKSEKNIKSIRKRPAPSSRGIFGNSIKGNMNGSKIGDELLAENFPKIFDISMGRGKTKSNRLIRTPGPCILPRSLHSSSMKCIIEYGYVKCLQLCAWGHTLEDGISQIMECYEHNDTWIPHRFRECEPFVDCGAGLQSPGNLNCTPITLTEGPNCTISCGPYEDKEAVEEDTYTCDVDGKWDKELPHCVLPSNALVLVEPPLRKQHDDEDIEYRPLFQ